MILDDLIFENEVPFFKFNAGELGFFYIISGYVKNGVFEYISNLLLKEDNNKSVGKHYYLSWLFIENNSLIIHYMTSNDKKDLFERQKSDIVSAI